MPWWGWVIMWAVAVFVVLCFFRGVKQGNRDDPPGPPS